MDAPCVQQFISHFDHYVSAVVQEIDDRSCQRRRTVDEYLTLRKRTSGGYLVFDLMEFYLGLPDHVMKHPQIASLTEQAVELIIAVNVCLFQPSYNVARANLLFQDLNSYFIEKLRGLDDHNLVTVAMHNYNLGLAGALQWMQEYGTNLVTRFRAEAKHVPSWDEEKDNKVLAYIDGIGDWIRGEDVWSFEAGRYFENGLAVQASCAVNFQPPTKGCTSHRDA
jgi:hypothetical protein